MTGKRMLSRIFVAVIASLLFWCSGAHATINFEATVNQQEITIDQTVTLTLTISGDISTVPNIPNPNFSDFDIVSQSSSQNFSFINGRFSLEYKKSYVLLPRKVGQLVIPSFTLKYGNQTISTKPIKITVKKQGATVSKPENKNSAKAGTQKSARSLFAETKLAQKSVFVGEPTYITFRYYRRVQVMDINFEPPTFTGVYSKLVQKSGESYTTYDGARYITQYFKYVIVPLNAGKVDIGRGRFIFSQGFFSAPVSRYTTPVTLTVKSLPAGGSDQFTGSIGKNVKVSISLAKSKIGDTETAQLRFVIEGTGSARFFNEPNIDLSRDFRVFDKKEDASEKYQNGELRARKTYTYILIPKHTGRIYIGPFSYEYFDYAKKQYITLRTNPVVLQVAGRSLQAGRQISQRSSAAPVVASKEQTIDYIIVRVPKQVQFNFAKILWGLLGLFLLINVLIFLANKGVLSRILTKKDIAKDTISSLNKALSFESVDEFLATIEQAIKEYLKRRYKLTVLDEHSLQRAGLEDFAALLNKVHSYRYAGEGSDLERRSMIEQAKKLIEEDNK